jgi:hypothetical protein
MHTFGGRVGGGAVGVNFALVQLIIHDDMRLPHGVGHPALARDR